MSATRREQLEAMVAVDPEDRELRYFLATEYFGLQRYGDALHELEEYFRRGEDEGVGYKMRGVCLFHLGRKEEARASLVSGIEAARRHRHTGLAAEIAETLEELLPTR
ncbi:MAG: hypothetical protein DMH00_08980 [Acidobacteria bacterium]|nr:MAG: hypothetical protein DMH00_08980 [Acidobacteriota bacterium]